jgi:hypothetical protein
MSDITSLVKIIERIERQRIKSLSNIQKFKPNTLVEYLGEPGFVLKVSPKLTSIIIEFREDKRIKFFTLKKKGRRSINELSIIK